MNRLIQLINVLVDIAFDELVARYPSLPLAWAQQFARELVEVLVRCAYDHVQREAELRAVYAKIEALLAGEEAANANPGD